VGEVIPDSPRLSDVVLAASELATNAVRHTGTRYTVRIAVQPNLIRLEVTDASSVFPSLLGLTDSHRGLRIVDAISESWGIDGNTGGKTVWAEFDL
jgi:hypothetical protein